jgi:adenine-specific DNA methylase
VQCADAAQSSLPQESSAVWFTETPKALEIVQCDKVKDNLGRPKDRKFYEEAMTKAFFEGCRVLQPDGIGSVVFAHKTTEGWEALLSGMIEGGWIITGSWPVTTEMGARLNAHETAALATSVHLVCRPGSESVFVGDRSDVLRELPNRVGNWMERLQKEKIRGADLIFACIGPALEIFSRYSKVETAEGREVLLAEYLEKVWEVVGRMALEQVLGTAEARARDGAAGVLEEDARLTALFLWTLQSTNVDVSRDKRRGSNRGYSCYAMVAYRIRAAGLSHEPRIRQRVERKRVSDETDTPDFCRRKRRDRCCYGIRYDF